MIVVSFHVVRLHVVALHVAMLHVVVTLLVIDDVVWSVVMLTCQPRGSRGVASVLGFWMMNLKKKSESLTLHSS